MLGDELMDRFLSGCPVDVLASEAQVPAADLWSTLRADDRFDLDRHVHAYVNANVSPGLQETLGPRVGADDLGLDVHALVQRFVRGESSTALAREVGCDPRAMRLILTRTMNGDLRPPLGRRPKLAEAALPEVVEQLAAGTPLVDIAAELDVSPHTVRNRLKRAGFDTTGLASRAQTTRSARQHRLTPKVPREDHPLVIDRYRAGETLDRIGQSYGCTRENIRLIIGRYVEIDGRAARRQHRAEAQEREMEQLRTQASALFASRPEVTLDDAKTLLGVRTLKGVIDEYDMAGRRDASWVARTPHEDLLAEVRRIHELTGKPVGPALYDKHRDRSMPTAQTVTIRFDTFTKACEAAGVPAAPTSRPTYTRKWSDEDLIMVVADYLTATDGPFTFYGFSDWLKATPDTPSAATVRNRIGPWNIIIARTKALLTAQQATG